MKTIYHTNTCTCFIFYHIKLDIKAHQTGKEKIADSGHMAGPRRQYFSTSCRKKLKLHPKLIKVMYLFHLL